MEIGSGVKRGNPGSRINWAYQGVGKYIVGDLQVAEMKASLMIPKLHTLVIHAEQFIMKYGAWGVFSEACSEHFQHVSLTTRRRHAFNKSMETQLLDDITYA